MSFPCAIILVLIAQIVGYGWAGGLRGYLLVDPVEMWWPSIVAQRKNQILSGYNGLVVGAVTIDWAGISAYHGSSLVTPWTSVLNVAAGFVMFIYMIVPLCYWKFNTFDEQRFPIFSDKLFTASGHKYDTTKIQFDLNIAAYEKYSKLYLSPLYAFSVGSGFLRFTATLTHVALFNGIYGIRAAVVPYIISGGMVLSLLMLLPGKPIANLILKLYGRISTTHALSFLSDLKLGHCMKIPPRCMYTASEHSSWLLCQSCSLLMDVREHLGSL
ncbi:hypothetical protein ACET3Z_026426 [Daucus carota]